MNKAIAKEFLNHIQDEYSPEIYAEAVQYCEAIEHTGEGYSQHISDAGDMLDDFLVFCGM